MLVSFASPRTVSAAIALTASVCVSLPVFAGPYSGHSDDPTNGFDPPIADSDPRIQRWASSVVDYSPVPGVVDDDFDNPSEALGPADAGIVSMGDLDQAKIDNGDSPGSITLGFDGPIRNRSGFDFAVFENAFAGNLSFGTEPTFSFAELAYVEVSTDGQDFARFPSTSTNTFDDPDGITDGSDETFGRDFALLDPTNIFNLAGKHLSGWGTPFDLDGLLSNPLVADGTLDLDEVNFVRLVDVPGSGDFLDSQGQGVVDSWVTQTNGGHDLDAVAVLPEPSVFIIITASSVIIGWRGTRPQSS